MEIKLYEEDLKEEYQHLSSNQVQFKHLNTEAQLAVELAGRGVYWSRITGAYEAIYPPHLGAYLEIKVKKVEKGKTIQACKNEHENTGRFCGLCGSPIFEQLKVELSYPDLWDLLGEKYDDHLVSITPYSMYNTETIIAIGNLLSRPCGTWLHLNKWGQEEEISDFPQPDKLIAELSNSYSDVIDYLRELDCVTGVEIKAGYVLNAEY